MTRAFSIPRSIIYGENALEHLSTLSGKSRVSHWRKFHEAFWLSG